jgi:hypothetical protein
MTGKGWSVMRSTTFRHQRSAVPVLGSMIWLAVGSFAVGFAGYLVFGLNIL